MGLGKVNKIMGKGSQKSGRAVKMPKTAEELAKYERSPQAGTESDHLVPWSQGHGNQRPSVL